MTRASDTVGRGREREQVSRSTKRVMNRAETSVDQDARDIANDALARSDSHERLCTERWNAQAATMARIEATMIVVNDAIGEKVGKIPASIIAGLAGLVGWLAARAFPIH